MREKKEKNGFQGPLKYITAWLRAIVLNCWSPVSRSSNSDAHAGIFEVFGKSWFKNKGDWVFALMGSELCSAPPEVMKLTESVTFLNDLSKSILKNDTLGCLLKCPKANLINLHLTEQANTDCERKERTNIRVRHNGHHPVSFLFHQGLYVSLS